MKVSDRIERIPINLILEPRMLLRLVDRDCIEYHELRDSMRDDDCLVSLLVRPSKEFPGKYEIIDGLHRFSCAKDIGLQSLPCIVKDVDDDKFLALQLKTQVIGKDLTPSECAQRLKKLLTLQPEMTLDELSHKIRKSPTWISDQLGLLGLRKDLLKKVDRGEMPMSSAYMLAKIPRHLQRQYVDQACTLPAGRFKAIAADAIKRYAEAVKLGNMEAFWKSKYTPHAFLRPLSQLTNELDRREIGGLLVTAEECKTPLDGFYAALRWACNLDRDSIAEQEAAARSHSKQKVV